MTAKAAYPCDLHTHTVNSDGNDTYQEHLIHAREAGLRVVAITDHDMRPLAVIEVDGEQMAPVDYAAQLGITLLPGIEISCDTEVEDCHIVGLGCDFAHPGFAKLEESVHQSKADGYRKLVGILSEDGPLRWQDVLENNGEPLKEGDVQRKHIFEAMARKGYAKDWAAAKLLVKDTPKYSVKREKPHPADAIRLILESGGIAIMAHPFLVEGNPQWEGRRITREAYIRQLIECGLVGIEACYPYEKTSYKGGQTSQEIEVWVRRKFEGTLPVISGGSDYHNDAKKGTPAEKARQLGEGGITHDYFFGNPVLQKLVKT